MRTGRHGLLYLVLAILLLAPGLRAAAQAAPPGVLTITVTERDGLARTQWPVTVGVPIACAEVKNPATFLTLVNARGAPVPFHIFDVVTPEAGPEARQALKGASFPADRPLTRIFEIGFPVDLAPNGSATFRLHYGTVPALPAAPRAPLRYAGEHPGVTIDTGEVAFTLNPKTGSLFAVRPAFSAGKQAYAFIQQRDVHYNPDVWSPPLGWGHTSDWDMGTPGPYAPALTVSQGAYAYRSFRSGIMPRSNETKTDVVYTFFAGMPFFYQSSRMEFTLNTLANAVRNSEYVFSRGLMTHAVWADAQGRPRTARLYDPADPTRIFGTVAVTPPDVQYLGFYNEPDGVGMCLVPLAHYTASFSLADNPMNLRSQFYIADPGLHARTNPRQDFVYLVRPEIYYVSSVVPKGTIFAERNAVLFFRLGPGEQRFDEMLHWVRLLRAPVQVDIAPLPQPPK